MKMDVKSFERVKDMLCDEMCEIAKGGKMTMETLTIADTLAHAIKNIDKIIMYDKYSEEDGAKHGGVPMNNEAIIEMIEGMMEAAHAPGEKETLKKVIEAIR